MKLRNAEATVNGLRVSTGSINIQKQIPVTKATPTAIQ